MRRRRYGWWWVRLTVLVLAAGTLGLPGVTVGTPTSPSALPAASGAGASTDFDTLAGVLGRAEAWQRVYGPGEVAVPDGPVVSDSAVAPEGGSGLDVFTALTTTLTPTVYLPWVDRMFGLPMEERRAIWITRYDWTRLGEAPAPETLDTMVAQIAAAGFNTIFFQVRVAGDAYYTPGLEPWASRLSAGPISETLGLDPGWDPLARMLAQGHAAGLEVHAYVNVYTAWLSPFDESYGTLWPPAVTPPQMFDRFTYGPSYAAHPGEYALGYTWRQYHEGIGDESATPMPLAYNAYLWASPGLDLVADHVAAVVTDIVKRYPVDGVHLDLVRYAGPAYSYDPFSNAAAGETGSAARDQWQRDQVTALVRRIHDAVHGLRREALVSAAVWPYYLDTWGWGLSEGYNDYYQDSKGWLAEGAVDAIAPMLYGGTPDDFMRWQVLMHDFVDDADGLPVYPGIGAHYGDFQEIAARIAAARDAGASGHVLFSYGALQANGYWDDLANGPYRVPATLP